MQQPGNCGDELSLYLCARMCTKHIAIIMKTSVWYTGKFNDGEDFIGLNDVDLILVYLGKGVFWETKERPILAFHPVPVPKNTPRSYNDEDYVPPRVYGPESPHRTPHTHSMGSPQVSETEPALQTTPPATPPKPHYQRKPKHFVVKQKVYKIRQGARHTYKCCSFCHEKFESQKELNSHMSGVHSFHFCVNEEPMARSSLQKWAWLNIDFVTNYHAVGAPFVDLGSDFNTS